MTLAVVVAVAAACAAPPPGDLPPLGPSGFRVMTWNLLGAQADDSVYSEHAGWAARVLQWRPDVLVLQEAQSEDVAAVTSRTGYSIAAYRWWTCDAKGNPEGVAVLVRPGLATTGGGGTDLGTACTDPDVRRVLVWADVVPEGATAALRVYGTHLTAGGGTATGSRRNQIRELRARVAADDPDGSGRWLVTGDLNVNADSVDLGLVLDGTAGETGPGALVDTFAEASPDAAGPACPSRADTPADQALLLADPGLVTRCGYTAGWAKDENPLLCDALSICLAWQVRRDTSVRNRIDYVLRAGDGPVRTVAAAVPGRGDPDWAAPGAEWFRLSDHLPVVTDLVVDPAG